jgi:hypothetical protein
MGTYPWGPHGPQSGPNEITPNPTPSYVPPPSAPAYAPPASPVSYGGGSYGVASNSAGQFAAGPRSKHYLIALILTFLFGPLGLFYASKKGALLVLFILIGLPVTLGVLGVLPGGSPAHPFSILDHDSVMTRMWSLCVVISMLWSVPAVWRHNAALKA